jgi:protein-S-isoprenylcysteine O-methyltransferase Ste14
MSNTSISSQKWIGRAIVSAMTAGFTGHTFFDPLFVNPDGIVWIGWFCINALIAVFSWRYMDQTVEQKQLK